MATPQVKFYAKASMPSENIDPNGLYFIRDGELYKGSQRFGLGRVTNASTEEELSAIVGVQRGDINIGFQGAKVYDGETWQLISWDIDSLTSNWRSDISTWISGLVSGGIGSIITKIEQAEDGKVTATAVAFPTFATGDNSGEVKLGSVSAKVNGWDALVSSVSDNASNIATNASNIASLSTTLAGVSSRVTGLEGIVDVSNGVVSAATGSFSNLNVSGTASVNALTINNSTVEDIAQAQIAAISSTTSTSSNNGITVSVTTQGGSVTVVSVDASTFGNVMHFRNVVSNTADVSDPIAGDIVVIGNTPDVGFVSGQEYIYTNAGAWELIGDQNTYALNAYTSTATVYMGATTLPAALNLVGAAVDTLNTDVSTLKTNVASLSSAIDALVGGNSTSSSGGIQVSISIDATTMSPSIGVSLDASALQASLNLGDAAYVSVANSIDESAATLPTCSAVSDYVTNALTWITV